MHTALYERKITLIASLLFALCLIAPLVIHAQASSPSDLNAAVRAAILQDPRAANLTPDQLNAMVNSLSASAQNEGLSVQDIVYTPGTLGIALPQDTTAVSNGAVDPCSQSSACTLGRIIASGVRRDAIYAGFWFLSILLIIVVWHMRRHPHLNGELDDAQETPAIGARVKAPARSRT